MPTRGSGWRDQWDRLNRWYGRFAEIDDGTVDASPVDHTPAAYSISASEHDEDVVYAFFQNCHHLKDWLHNDPAASTAVGDVDAVIDGSADLKLCADLANGTKHLKLNRKTRTGDPSTAFVSRSINVTIGNSTVTTPGSVSAAIGAGPRSRIATTFEVESGGNKRDAFAVATGCLDEWKRHLTSVGLL